MFRYYMCPSAYSKTSCLEIEVNMKELNHVLTEHSDEYDSFHYDMSLFDVLTAGDTRFADVIWGNLIDRQFSKTVLPQLMNKLTVLNRSYKDKADFDSEFNDTQNALWGVRFNTDEQYHISNAEKYKAFRAESLKVIMCKENFKELRPLLCPNLLFTDEAIDRITTGSDKIFSQMIDRLVDLDKYASSWKHSKGPFSVGDLNSTTSLRVSDESDTVKNNDKKRMERYFILPGIGGRYCYLHIKTGDYRFHFYADEDSHKVYVAYIGPHLTL